MFIVICENIFNLWWYWASFLSVAFNRELSCSWRTFSNVGHICGCWTWEGTDKKNPLADSRDWRTRVPRNVLASSRTHHGVASARAQIPYFVVIQFVFFVSLWGLILKLFYQLFWIYCIFLIITIFSFIDNFIITYKNVRTSQRNNSIFPFCPLCRNMFYVYVYYRLYNLLLFSLNSWLSQLYWTVVNRHHIAYFEYTVWLCLLVIFSCSLMPPSSTPGSHLPTFDIFWKFI